MTHDDVTNKSGDRHFEGVLEVSMSCRLIICGGLASAASVFAASNPGVVGRFKLRGFGNV